jgi:hypothetical protein
MIYTIKTILFIWSIHKLYKAITKEDFDYLFDGTFIGLLGILIKPI